MKASAATLERIRKAESAAESGTEASGREKQKILADARRTADRIAQSAKADSANLRTAALAKARSELEAERRKLEGANRKAIESAEAAARKKSPQQIKELLEEFGRRFKK